MNAFDQLRLPLDLAFDASQLREAYRAISKEMQLQQSDESTQATLTAAYQMLLSPAMRLRHWLELKGHAGNVRGEMDGDLLVWFAEVANLLQAADDILRRREECQTLLAKAMLETRMHQIRMQIEQCQQQLQQYLEQKMQKFPAIVSGDCSAEAAWVCVRDLSFIEKWQQQLRERYGKFFS